MKKNTLQAILLVIILSISTFSFGQKLVKIKGSKVVTTTEITLDSIVSLELFKNIDLILTQGDEDKLTIFADDNLHDIVDVDLADGKLSLSLLNKISSKKKFELSLQLVNLEELIMNSNSKLSFTNHFKVNTIDITLNDKAHGELLFDAIESITYTGNDKSKGDVSFKSEFATFTLLDNAKIKGVSTLDELKVETIDKATIELSGKCETVLLDAKDSSNMKLTNLITDSTEILATGKTTIRTNTTTDLLLDLKEASKIYFYGKAVVELKGFSGTATLFKKE
ncbi:MAG: DUF2807 domain-containing protein [Flavobacteriaceae bacterium]